VAFSNFSDILKFKYSDKKTVTFFERPADIENSEAKLVGETLVNYFTALETKNYEAWMNEISAQTKDRIIGPKFPRKFERLCNSGIGTWAWRQKEVVQFKKMDIPEAGEKGNSYYLLLRLPKGKKLPFRTGFDPLVSLEVENEDELFGLHMTQVEDGTFDILIWKMARTGGKKPTPKGKQ
jgi:hypothetical protein